MVDTEFSQQIKAIRSDLMDGRISRREAIRRAAALGIAPQVAVVIFRCPVIQDERKTA